MTEPEPTSIAGRRRPDGMSIADLEPGDFVKRQVLDATSWERWWVCCPDGGVTPLAHVKQGNGPAHVVTEHEDGTISVLPYPERENLIVSPRGWQGYIRRGRWEST